MPIDLPPLPRRTKIAPRLLRFGGDLRAPLGGPTIRITRLGSRFAVDVEVPTMDLDCARRMVAARMRAEALGDTLRMQAPRHEGGAAAGTPTAIAGAVNSATLTRSGGGPIAVGMFFSFAVGGRTYLHMVTSVTGNALGVAPLLRASPVGQVLDFANPLVEGLVDDVTWSEELMRFVGQSFTLTEAR